MDYVRSRAACLVAAGAWKMDPPASPDRFERKALKPLACCPSGSSVVQGKLQHMRSGRCPRSACAGTVASLSKVSRPIWLSVAWARSSNRYRLWHAGDPTQALITPNAYSAFPVFPTTRPSGIVALAFGDWRAAFACLSSRSFGRSCATGARTGLCGALRALGSVLAEISAPR